MTAVVDLETSEDDEAQKTVEINFTTSTERLAGWLPRAGALAVDVVFGAALAATMAVLQAASPQHGVLRWVYVSFFVLAVVAVAVNRVVLPGFWGWTLGRALFGIAVVRRDGEDVGLIRLMLRDLAHLMDTVAVGIGWLWPLWDSRHRTFADLLTRTEVRRVERNAGRQRPVARRWTVIMVFAVAALCAVAVGCNYFAVFRYERAVDVAREQLAVDGPMIVEDVLSFGADTRGADFTNAQTRVTEGYRPQLVQDQLTAASQPPFTNDFWTVGQAILAATPDRGSMLIMLHGTRVHSEEDVTFVTTAVRVSFEKVDGEWLLSNLEVLSKQQPPVEAPK